MTPSSPPRGRRPTPLKVRVRRRDPRFPFLLATVIVLAVLALLSSRAQGAFPVGSNAAELAVEVVAATPVPQAVTAFGVVHAAQDTVLSARLLAPVTAIPVHEGDTVRRGDVLVELDRKGLSAQLTAATAAATQAQAAQTEAQAEFERVQGLAARGSATRRDQERATSAHTQAVAAAHRADAQVAVIEEQLSHTRIRAPFDGQVVERRVDVGEMATPGLPLVRVATTDVLELWVDVPQQQIHHIRSRQSAHISLNGQPPLAATVVRIVPAANPRSHTFTVKLAFERPAAPTVPTVSMASMASTVPVAPIAPTVPTVLTGMFARATLPYGSRDRITVPTAAISRRAEVTGVYVLEAPGQPPVLRLVRAGRVWADRQVIESGLSVGETIVIDAAAAARARADVPH